ncbi:hypothetical protein RCL1_004787 [Eukaryota sp. TZLM3-RCL]
MEESLLVSTFTTRSQGNAVLKTSSTNTSKCKPCQCTERCVHEMYNEAVGGNNEAYIELYKLYTEKEPNPLKARLCLLQAALRSSNAHYKEKAAYFLASSIPPNFHQSLLFAENASDSYDDEHDFLALFLIYREHFLKTHHSAVFRHDSPARHYHFGFNFAKTRFFAPYHLISMDCCSPVIILIRCLILLSLTTSLSTDTVESLTELLLEQDTSFDVSLDEVPELIEEPDILFYKFEKMLCKFVEHYLLNLSEFDLTQIPISEGPNLLFWFYLFERAFSAVKSPAVGFQRARKNIRLQLRGQRDELKLFNSLGFKSTFAKVLSHLLSMCFDDQLPLLRYFEFVLFYSESKFYKAKTSLLKGADKGCSFCIEELLSSSSPEILMGIDTPGFKPCFVTSLVRELYTRATAHFSRKQFHEAFHCIRVALDHYVSINDQELYIDLLNLAVATSFLVGRFELAKQKLSDLDASVSAEAEKIAKSLAAVDIDPEQKFLLDSRRQSLKVLRSAVEEYIDVFSEVFSKLLPKNDAFLWFDFPRFTKPLSSNEVQALLQEKRALCHPNRYTASFKMIRAVQSRRFVENEFVEDSFKFMTAKEMYSIGMKLKNAAVRCKLLAPLAFYFFHEGALQNCFDCCKEFALCLSRGIGVPCGYQDVLSICDAVVDHVNLSRAPGSEHFIRSFTAIKNDTLRSLIVPFIDKPTVDTGGSKVGACVKSAQHRLATIVESHDVSDSIRSVNEHPVLVSVSSFEGSEQKARDVTPSAVIATPTEPVTKALEPNSSSKVQEILPSFSSSHVKVTPSSYSDPINTSSISVIMIDDDVPDSHVGNRKWTWRFFCCM